MKVYKDKEFKEIRPALVYTVCDFCGKEFKNPSNIKTLDVVNLKEERDYYDHAIMIGGYDTYNGWQFDICVNCLARRKNKTVFVEDKRVTETLKGRRKTK